MELISTTKVPPTPNKRFLNGVKHCAATKMENAVDNSKANTANMTTPYLRVFRSDQCFPFQSLGQLFPALLGCSSFLCISLLLYGLVSSTMPTESSSSSSPSFLFSSSVSPSFKIISPEPDNAVDVSSSPQFSLKLAQNSLREIFHHQIFGEHNAFESTRYGLRIDHCPNGGEPEVSEQDGRIKLCQLDAECKPTFKCANIVGLTHFGKQMRFCCATKISVCTLKPKLVTDISSFPAGCHRPPLRTFYYFDVDRQKCAKGRMAQCEGFGDNRFATELECRTKCETTACEFGESILLHNDSFDSPFVCSSDDDCPVGYNCRQDHIFRRSVCCGFLNFGWAKSCKESDVRDECPADFVCTQNAISKAHFCCTVEKGVCPHGHQAYIHPLTDGTIKCNLRNFDPTTSCPPGYVCLEAVFGSIWGFCCAQTMTGTFMLSESVVLIVQFDSLLASCPEGSHPQINLITNQPQRCELTQQPSVCTSEFECETDEATHLGFCCSIRRHEKVKPTAEPMARKRTKTQNTARNTTEEVPMTTTTTITTTITIKENRAEEEMELNGILNSNSVENERKRRPQSNEMGRESARKREGRQRKRGRWKERKARKRGRQRGESHSSSSSSSEQSEKADLMELSTKLVETL
ncbi:hypothetical protein niasHT_031601 [Heterodera trifolii]|uniref:BPTI/Kunitz inhibitor domain-containing protein n=1 Tax=Heterodera trifolii TaxID=157864 RepID=A0ABD2J426_9BILA